jgi:hypothetical protein
MLKNAELQRRTANYVVQRLNRDIRWFLNIARLQGPRSNLLVLFNSLPQAINGSPCASFRKTLLKITNTILFKFPVPVFSQTGK